MLVWFIFWSLALWCWIINQCRREIAFEKQLGTVSKVDDDLWTKIVDCIPEQPCCRLSGHDVDTRMFWKNRLMAWHDGLFACLSLMNHVIYCRVALRWLSFLQCAAKEGSHVFWAGLLTLHVTMHQGSIQEISFYGKWTDTHTSYSDIIVHSLFR